MSLALETRTVEWTVFPHDNVRGDQMRHALTQTPHDTTLIQTLQYLGDRDVLMLWGPGAPSRFGPMRQQVAKGGHVVAWDLAYWHRDRKIRCSIDAAHPQAWVMKKDWPVSRFREDRVPVVDTWNPKGHVIVAGIGQKAKVQYGSQVDHWEAEMIVACQARGWPVRYRHKAGSGPLPTGVQPCANAVIDRALEGARLVITWHSNVAVDAIRCGIPAVCRDGAAAAVCSSTLSDRPSPLPVAVRDRFLANLAWFQWGTSAQEVQTFWRFLSELLA